MKVDELEVVLRRQGSFYKDVHVILGSVYYLYSRVSPLLVISISMRIQP